MSKVNELRIKYPKVTKATFNKLVDADFTPTKKYLEFMLKTWDNREKVMIYITTSVIIDLVKQFDSLLPYIDNKDIYSSAYADLSLLKYVIENAEKEKEEKSFVREDNAVVLLENDKYLLIQPTTHRGSLKYGAGTKWCTAGKNDPNTFNRYVKNGFLVYLVDKTGERGGNYGKIALYHEFHNCPINDSITCFNTIDNNTTMNHIKGGGKWGEDEMFDILTCFRYYFMKMKAIKKDKDVIDSFVGALTGLNFEQFEKSLSNLEDMNSNSYTSKIKDKVEEFLTKLNKTHYAIR
jgi:hypothetical protein